MIFFDLDQTTVNSLYSVNICDGAASMGLDWLQTWREIRTDPRVVEMDEALPLMQALIRMYYAAPDLVAVATARQLSELEKAHLHKIGLPLEIPIYDRNWATKNRLLGRDWTLGGGDALMKVEIAKRLGVESAMLIDDMPDNIEAFKAQGWHGIDADMFEAGARTVAMLPPPNKNPIWMHVWAIGALYNKGMM